MIIIDQLLKQRYEENKPIQVGIIGAGYMGRGIVLQIESAFKGMRSACLYNRNIRKAEIAYEEAGIENYISVSNVDELEDAIKNGRYAVCDDPYVVCESPSIEAIIEATGEIEFGAHVTHRAISNKKHVVLMNAELDATIGPILKKYADKAGVIITNADGDQPGVIMNKYRFVEQIGYQPVLAGNIKGMEDPYRTPETQKGFAEKFKQKPKMVTSFADGTKLSMEMAVVANATGFKAGQRGMYGPQCEHVSESVNKFPLEKLLDGGLVDYILGAEPGPGIFILGYNDEPKKKQYMKYFKMGNGPLYVFYVPYHLPHLEVPITVARAALTQDAAIAPKNGPVCEVVTIAKRDLKAGERLDGIGGFTCYSAIENTEEVLKNNILPMGLSEGCVLKNDIGVDQVISYEDVYVPPGRFVDDLYRKQKLINNRQ